jgi:hypothetical protein
MGCIKSRSYFPPNYCNSRYNCRPYRHRSNVIHVWEYEFSRIQFEMTFLLIVLIGSNYRLFNVPIQEGNFKMGYIFYGSKLIIKSIVPSILILKSYCKNSIKELKSFAQNRRLYIFDVFILHPLLHPSIHPLT